MSRMPEDELTKTIRDAIWITQGLGLRYLWVDSVCIIQDSTQDWDKESASMASVYGGSTINIAASGAKDGSWGCFLKPPGFIGKVHVEATRDDITKAWDIAPSLFYSSVVKGHLSSRGWALQERILAPRTLHFTDTELFWECKLVNARESFPEGLHEFENQHVFHLDRKPISEVWHTIVGLYTQANLTFLRDKLVAIAGIARVAQEETQDQYLAGMWRQYIEFQLPWCQTGSRRQVDRTGQYRAPSWSWASVHGSYVYYPPLPGPKDSYRHYAHVIDAHIMPSGPDPLGQLGGGVLTMSCSAMLSGKVIEYPSSFIDSYEVEIPTAAGCEAFEIYPDTRECVNRTVYVLPLVHRLGNGTDNEDEEVLNYRSIDGILLAPSNNNKGEYNRIGFFWYSRDDEVQRDRFVRALEASGTATAESACARILSNPKFAGEPYVITII
jgi:hypothetical protein